GSGKHPAATDRVKCHYEGRLIDGTVFDSSYRRGEPATFPLNGVIAGWTEGLQLMGEGAKFRFFIPYNLAYGARGAGESIPPYAALVFDVELIEVQ
ncbi:MAG: FKBP-type peptidyl-prolyl cis-trans isomerase, partial [Bacteroidales bacterium]